MNFCLFLRVYFSVGGGCAVDSPLEIESLDFLRMLAEEAEGLVPS